MSKKKDELRKVMLGRRAAQSEREMAEKCDKIKNVLLSRPEFAGAGSIMFYLAKNEEVRTEDAIRQALLRGKRVLVPLVKRDERRLIPSILTDYDRQLIEGIFGILEPKKEHIHPFSPSEIELVIVPGVAFDRKGGRIGFGGGFYDNFLSGLPAYKIGLAYEVQIAEELPLDDGDVPVDMIITEDRVYPVNSVVA